MAAHQDIGVQEHGEGFRQLSEQLQEMLAVTLVAKDVATLISASRPVRASSQNRDAQGTCHAGGRTKAKDWSIVEM